MRYLAFILVIPGLFMMSCSSKQNPSSDQKQSNSMYDHIDIQGHRGCRALFPENTLPAFQKALELNVNTLELDLAISKDHKVLVSHEPYFRAGLSITPDGRKVTKEEERDHNIYEMDYEQVKAYDVGSLPDERYPVLENLKTYKPLLKQVVDKARHYAYTFSTPFPDLNIEIKRRPEYDNLFHPDGETFVNLVLQEVKELDIFDETIIQSFDLESLRLVKQKEPRIRTALLIENMRPLQDNISELGFKPDIYSCYFKLLKEEDISYCKEKGIKVIPWTVNSKEDIQAMLDLGVDGIISDYPDRVLELTDRI